MTKNKRKKRIEKWLEYNTRVFIEQVLYDNKWFLPVSKTLDPKFNTLVSQLIEAGSHNNEKE